MDPYTPSGSSSSSSAAADDLQLPASSSPSTSTSSSSSPAGPRRISPESDDILFPIRKRGRFRSSEDQLHLTVRDLASDPPPPPPPSSFIDLESDESVAAGVEGADPARNAGSSDRKGKRVADEVVGDDDGVLLVDRDQWDAARARRRRLSVGEEEEGEFELAATDPSPSQAADIGLGGDGLGIEVLPDDHQGDWGLDLSIGLARIRRFGVEEKGNAELGLGGDGLQGAVLADDQEDLADVDLAQLQLAAQHPVPDRLDNEALWMEEKNRRRVQDVQESASRLSSSASFKEKREGDEEEEEDEKGDLGELHEDLPFSTAMKIIRDLRGKLLEGGGQQLNHSKSSEPAEARINWAPSLGKKGFRPRAPSLEDLCMRVLAENSEEIGSLANIADTVKRKLVSILCGSRKMSYRIFKLLVSESPPEISLPDCSWLKEEELERVFMKWKTADLKELQLDLCGRSHSDNVLSVNLAKQANSLKSLTKLSLRGAYRISDDGLKSIASSAPILSSINLSWHPRITADGITHVTRELHHVLRELHIDNCQGIDAMGILPALRKVRNLEVLSVSGIETVSREFINIMALDRGKTLWKLNLANCQGLKNSAMKSIADNCPLLCALDIRDVTRLNDSALKHLANGCRSIHNLKFRRNKFSNEAIAAFLEASGSKLLELSLNHVQKITRQKRPLRFWVFDAICAIIRSSKNNFILGFFSDSIL